MWRVISPLCALHSPRPSGPDACIEEAVVVLEPRASESSVPAERGGDQSAHSGVPPSSPSKRYRAKHVIVVALLSVLFAGIVNWPVVVHLTTEMPNTPWDLQVYSRPSMRGVLGDPMFLAWEVAW